MTGPAGTVGRHKKPSPASDPGTARPHRTGQVISLDGGSGQLETSVGRVANTAPTALPTFTLIGEISGSDRFYTNDITTPVVMHDSEVNVPTGPGCATNQSGVEREPEHSGAHSVDI